MHIGLQNVAFIPHQRNHLRHGLQSMLKLTIDQTSENKCQWDAQPQTKHLYHVFPETPQGLKVIKG